MSPVENDQKPPELTQAQQAELQDFLDEQTVFGLAVLMVDLHTASLLKSKQGIVNAVMKTSVLLRNNPGFVGRFKAAQKEAIEKLQKAQAKSLVKPPSVSVLKKGQPS